MLTLAVKHPKEEIRTAAARVFTLIAKEEEVARYAVRSGVFSLMALYASEIAPIDKDGKPAAIKQQRSESERVAILEALTAFVKVSSLVDKYQVVSHGGPEFLFAAMKGANRADKPLIKAGEADFREDSALINEQVLLTLHELITADAVGTLSVTLGKLRK